MEKEKSREQMLVDKPSRRFDLAHLIKWIVLIVLVILVIIQLSAGEMQKLARADTISWIILAIKLILIAVIIILMRVQRCLKCEILKPDGCTAEEQDPGIGILYVDVSGTATGSYFSHYTLGIHQGGNPKSVDVYYPGGGASGMAPVSNGHLGKIDTTSLPDGAYEVVLTVYPYGSGSPKICKKTFTLLKAIVYISKVANVSAISNTPTPGNPNPYDPNAELSVSDGTGFVPRSFGGNMAVHGSAYVYECPGRKIKSYAIRYAGVSAPGGEPTQPAPDAAVPGAFTGMLNPLPLEYLTADHYQLWNRIGPGPKNLINSWQSITIGTTTYPKLKSQSWNSNPAGSGRYSLLLTVEDTAGHLYHDIQHIWIDNHQILGKIVKFQWFNKETSAWEDLPKCKDLSMKKFGKIRILGLAWDPVIDEAWWPPTAPNDNFECYDLDFKKQFGTYQSLAHKVPNRVPALPATTPVAVPTDAEADELAVWDITTLDAGVAPSPYVPAPDPKIYRGESCTYTLKLYVHDNSIVNHDADGHEKWDFESVKIINDL